MPLLILPATPAVAGCGGLGANLDAGCNPDATVNPVVPGVDLTATDPGGTVPSTTDPSTATDPPRVAVLTDTPRPCDTPTQQCTRPDTPPPPPAEPGEPTITDIATFPVTVAIAHNQPTGWGVVGKPTNFYTTGGSHDVAGTLLGRPATVRFTPIAWHWDYGDGDTTSHSIGGRPWTQATQLQPTPTSHSYDTKGSYTVTLLIDYRAEYQYAGQPWRTVNGGLRVRTNDLTITTWRVKTVLVAHDCIQNPHGIGCPTTR